MLDHLAHKYLKIPYTLHVHHITRPKKPTATYIFLHGLGNSGGTWDEVIRHLPADVRIISLDLLGFGNSPKPEWAKYNAPTQARSVATTLFSLRIIGKVTLIGHSLGALTAIEVSRKYPLLVNKLVLCSPPLYLPDEFPTKLPVRADKILKSIYRSAIQRQDKFMTITNFATRYNLVNKSFKVTKDNVHAYMTALEAMIINQSSYDDAVKLSVPTHIIEGSLDPFVVHGILKKLKRENPNVTLQLIFAGHEVRGLFTKAVINYLNRDLKNTPITKTKPNIKRVRKNKV